jgi:glycine betaine catabolism B
VAAGDLGFQCVSHDMMLAAYASLLRDHKIISDTLARRHAPGLSAPSVPRTAGETRRIVDRVHPQHIRWKVAELRDETPTSRTLVLAPLTGEVPAFLPGQYLNVFVEVGGTRTSRPQSISSSPTRPGVVELTVKEKIGGFVSRCLVRELAAGDELTTSGPEGDFVFNGTRGEKRLLLIAGGSGITPFMGMVGYVMERYPAVSITLLYGSRAADDVIFEDRLHQLARQHPDRLKIVLVLWAPDEHWQGERGAIDRHLIARHVSAEDLRDAGVFLCGPRPMQEHVLNELDVLDVPAHHVQVESSGFADDITALEGWPAAVTASTTFSVSLPGRKVPAPAKAGEPLITSLERAGVNVPALCRNGACGVCRHKLVSGEIFADPAVATRASDRKAGYILLCASYPLSDIALAGS